MKLYNRLTLTWLKLKFIIDAYVIYQLWGQTLPLLLAWLLIKFGADAIVIMHLWKQFRRWKDHSHG